ncbi:diiron oxygenase [soil metagenome]
MAPTTIDDRIDRLSTASVRRMIEPDTDVAGQLGDGAVLPDELLSVAGLDLDLEAGQRARLSREEVASIVAAGIRFEAVLIAGFALDLATAPDLTDPRVTYAFHELGEETRHSRLFVRLLTQLQPTATNPLDRPILRRIERLVLPRLIARPALLDVLVLAGEEIPDRFQKLAAEHPDTDPFLRDVNRYHRQEEARHLAFARMVLPERWSAAGPVERFLVRRVAPTVIRGMFDTMVHPGVYATVGLPTWSTWKAANRTPERVAIRHTATRGVLAALLEAGVLGCGAVPRPWRDLCGVDRHGEPVAA